MALATYGLCALVALICTFLLLAAYRRQGHRLLLWSGACFAGLTANNVLLVLDKVVLPAVDLSFYRAAVALAAIMVLLYGLIWEVD